MYDKWPGDGLRTAEVRIDPSRILGPINDEIYGQFIEHVGRAIYGGVFEPGSPHADDRGYRLDALAACRELRPSVLRWPGGNFASGYHWRDGVGPVEGRPVRHDLAWDARETNRFGTEEFLELARRLEAAPYLNLNVSTGTVDEALGWLEYCNGGADLDEARLRRAGPHPEPHSVPIWGLGNENYGWWQHGHTSAQTYAEVAREWGKLLRWADPDIRLIGVGAPQSDWNWTVLKTAGRFIDYLSLHFYWHGAPGDEYHSTLAGPLAAEEMIEGTWGMCRLAQREQGLALPVRIAVDEWNVWTRTAPKADAATVTRYGFSARSRVDRSFEEDYDLKDALAVATFYHVLWRHPEAVTMATMAQMVNVLAPIRTGPEGVVRYPIFHPCAIARREAGPIALDVDVRSDAAAGSLPALDVAATTDRATRLHVSLVNRSRDEDLEVGLPGLSGEARRILLWHEDPAAGAEAVAPVEDRIDPGRPLVLPPHSHVTLVLPCA